MSRLPLEYATTVVHENPDFYATYDFGVEAELRHQKRSATNIKTLWTDTSAAALLKPSYGYSPRRIVIDEPVYGNVWDQIRRLSIGASDLGKMQTMNDAEIRALVEDKSMGREREPFRGNRYTYAGHRFESSILEETLIHWALYREALSPAEYATEALGATDFLVVPDMRVMVSPDLLFLNEGILGMINAKSCGNNSAVKYRERMSQEHYLQMCMEMYLTDADVGIYGFYNMESRSFFMHVGWKQNMEKDISYVGRMLQEWREKVEKFLPEGVGVGTPIFNYLLTKGLI